MRSSGLVIAFAVLPLTACVGEIGGERDLPSSGAGGSGAGAATVTGTGGAAGAGGSSSSSTGVPCDVAALISGKCASCHGATPVAGVPMSLATYADLTAPSKSDPTVTNAALAVTRMMSTTGPMPPAGSPPATAAEIAAVQNWIAAGYPMTTSCGTVAPDPFSVAPTCTSNQTWSLGDQGSPVMDPGKACISCHATTGGEAPSFTIAGTVYPTAHEPDLCNGANGTNGALVVITGADGKSFSLAPNAAGNFSWTGTLAKPFQAKVTYMGRERDMSTAQTSGDCNSCHTQSGTMSAPGRIILP
jgi:hypothetical protein